MTVCIKEAGRVFSGLFDSITNDQKDLIDRTFNFSDSISSQEMKRILFSAFFDSKNKGKAIRRGLCRKMKRTIKGLFYPRGLFE